MINLTSLNCYSYDNLPSGKQGIIRQDGTFISFADISSKPFSQNSIKTYIEENYIDNIIEIIGEKNYLLYQFRKNIYNYKDIIVDFLGYATYEAYITSPIPIIKVPNSSINEMYITKEQEKVLMKLVKINNNDLSYLPFNDKEKVKVKK